jgi:hypothetical protein
LIGAGALTINIERIYPLDAIVAAQEHNRSGRTRGKVVVDMGVGAPAAPVSGRLAPQGARR